MKHYWLIKLFLKFKLMKIILGDNQFFGVNHFDLNKGKETKLKFDTNLKLNVL